MDDENAPSKLVGTGLLLTDGGLETSLIFQHGLDLPCFAAFDLLKDEDGLRVLRSYFEPYLAIAHEHGVGFVLDTVTGGPIRIGRSRLATRWRTSTGRTAPRSSWPGRSARLRKTSERRSRSTASWARGDGYEPGALMSADEAQSYHARQIGVFAEEGVDMVTAVTMNYPEEAVGIVRAARAAGLPVVISFTVETDGNLPTGQSLRAAIEQVDAETGSAAAYFMINCAHPTHFAERLLEDGDWLERIGGIRANASTKSHAELDESDELDAGDPLELGAQYAALRPRLRRMRVLGGCCGTDHAHIRELCSAWLAAAPG